MVQFLFSILEAPFIVLGTMVDFVVWGSPFSDGRWKRGQGRPNPARYWQNQALAARRQLRDLEYESRRQQEEDQDRFRKELKRKERES